MVWPLLSLTAVSMITTVPGPPASFSVSGADAGPSLLILFNSPAIKPPKAARELLRIFTPKRF
jgi:hypothetical protein